MSPVLKHLFVQSTFFVSKSCSGDVSLFFVCAFTTGMVDSTSIGPAIIPGAVFSRLLLVSEAFQGVIEFGVGCSNLFSQLRIRVCERHDFILVGRYCVGQFRNGSKGFSIFGNHVFLREIGLIVIARVLHRDLILSEVLVGEGKLCLEGGPGLVGSIFLSPCFAFVAKKIGAVDDVVGHVRNLLLIIWSVPAAA